MSSRANNKATKASAAANSEALAFERQQYAEQQAAAKAQWDAEEARKAPYRAMKYARASAYAAQHGFTLPPPTAPTYPGFTGTPTGDVTGRPAGVGPSVGSSMTLGRLAGMQPGPAIANPNLTPALEAPPMMTLGELGRRT
jgi:hypothetical protein